MKINNNNFLIYDNQVEYLDSKQQWQIIHLHELKKNSFPSYKLFLGFPYVITYIHSTIPLSKKDLKNLDNNLFFKDRDYHQSRQIYSLILPDKRITIHSHLTPKGQTLISDFKKNRTKIIWVPLITHFIHHFLANPLQLTLSNKDIITVFFAQEMIIIFKDKDSWDFDYYLNWFKNDASKNTNQNKLLNFVKLNYHTSPLILSENETQKIKGFILNKKLSKAIQFVHWQDKTNFLPIKKLKKYLSSLHIVVSIALLMIFYVVYLFYQVHQAKEDFEKIKSQTKNFNTNNTSILNPAIGLQMKYLRLQSLKKAIMANQLHPEKILSQIEELLDANSRLESFQLDSDNLKLILIWSSKSNLKSMLGVIEKKLGLHKIVIKKNEQITINDQQANKYYIEAKLGKIKINNFIKKGN